MASPSGPAAATPRDPSREVLQPRLSAVVEAVARVVYGHDAVARQALAAILARGHVLFEDVPGVGKTTLARALARVLGCSFARLQFTADMLPSDLLGVQVLDPKEGALRFRKGPVFAEVVLADEINRASPKTQSAMLEAMAERRVTIDDTTHELSPVFSVLATQNPLEHHGAYPLPESQLDRFMVRVALGYPSLDEERRLVLEPHAPEDALSGLAPLLSPAFLRQAQDEAAAVLLSAPLADYLLAVVRATREHAEIELGASPRAAMALSSLARAWAYLDGRAHVLPDDVQTLAVPVLAHRLTPTASSGPEAQRRAARAVVEDVLARTPVPR